MCLDFRQCTFPLRRSATFNPRTRNPISSRIFWKRHHEMDSSWGTIKNRFRTKITFLSQIFQERTLARVPISLTDRYWEFWQISFFLLQPEEILFLFFYHISRISREIKLFLMQNHSSKLQKVSKRKFSFNRANMWWWIVYKYIDLKRKGKYIQIHFLMIFIDISHWDLQSLLNLRILFVSTFLNPSNSHIIS